jgi:hypothetical protein
LNVTIQQRSQLTATGTFTTANNSTSSFSMTVQFNHAYDADSSLAAVEGTYAVNPQVDVLNISNNGQFTYAEGNCNATGTVSIIDAQWNLYTMHFDFPPGCQFAGLNVGGATLDGLLTLDITQSPARLTAYLHGTLQGAPAAVIWVSYKT